MKKLFSFVIVLLLGFCGWIRFTSTRPTEAHRTIITGLKDEMKESRADFDTTNEALVTAKGEIENLKRRLESLEGEAVARSFPAQTGPERGNPTVASPVTAPVPVPAAGPAGAPTQQDRLSLLRATYDSHRLSIENRKSILEGEISVLKTKRKSVENTELHFSEQSTRVDVDGMVTGNRNVRTSSAARSAPTKSVVV